jgi:hypothetical protein
VWTNNPIWVEEGKGMKIFRLRIMTEKNFQKALRLLPFEPEKVGFVLLVCWDSRRLKVKSYRLGESWYANAYDLLPDWRTKLLPDGKTEGVLSIEAWEPVTENMVELYHMKNQTPQNKVYASAEAILRSGKR